MQKLFKSPIFMFILGVTIAIGITSVFAYDLFASSVGFTPADTNWNVENTQDAIDELRELSFKTELLWTNQDVTTVFSGQTIPLNLSKYKYILITLNAEINYIYFPRGYSLIPVGDNYEFSNHVGITGGSCYRNIRANSSGVVISDESKCGSNRYAIPYKIYGIRGDLKIDIQ